MHTLPTILSFFAAIAFAPLLSGLINRVKAYFAGRQGRPLLQLYFDIYKLWQKKSVYPYASSWVFRLAPPVNISATLFILLFLPFGNVNPFFSFTGDFVLVAGLLALIRFSLVLGALDTGSAFEGMGAAREALFGAMAEPVFLLALVCLAYESGQASITGMFSNIPNSVWLASWPFYVLLSLTLFIIMLIENSRMPADDPNTHLELTMIHEVMILDHSAAELAMLEYASALKLWIFCQLIATLLFPTFSTELSTSGNAALQLITTSVHLFSMLGVIFILAALIGIVESSMARLRMERVPQLLTLAASFTCLAALLLWS